MSPRPKTRETLMNKAEKKVVQEAISILNKEIVKREVVITSPQIVIDFLRLNLETAEQEIFAVLFLDTKHRLIEFRKMFFGTIDQASVYPREVAKASLKLNAAAIIVSHNHPSGVSEASRADKSLTESLIFGLDILGIKVLDHVVIGKGEYTSFAERGWL